MNIYSNFKEFYDAKLLPDLKILDGERKKVDRKVLIILLVAVVLIILIGRIFNSSGNGYFLLLVGILAFIAITIVSHKYRSNFKTKIVKKITAFVDEDLMYSPQGYVSREEFNDSGMFQ